MARARLEGLGRALRQVAAVPEAMREAREETLHEWAAQVQDGAERRVPRDTGGLWAALDHEVDASAGTAEVGVWDAEALEYAEHVEHGTSSMRAQPYLVPAFEEARGDVARTYRGKVRGKLGEIT